MISGSEQSNKVFSYIVDTKALELWHRAAELGHTG